MAVTKKWNVSKESLLALAARIAAEEHGDRLLAGTGVLKLRVWEAGQRFEVWRLVVTHRATGREHQLVCWADWERFKRLAHPGPVPPP